MDAALHMSARPTLAADQTDSASMSVLERDLTLWVCLCIVTGIVLGQTLPETVQFIAKVEFAQVNIPVGLLSWVMIIPMLIKIDFDTLGQIKNHWRGIGVTLCVNWASGRGWGFSYESRTEDASDGYNRGVCTTSA